MNSSTFLRPAFVVGVTGNRDPCASALEENQSAIDIHAKLRLLFRFIQDGAQADDGKLLRQVQASLPHLGHAPGLGEWRGLGNTPIWVLSSLAPGADSLVAEVALDLGYRVLAPLPFAQALYRNASTFVDDAQSPTRLEQTNQLTYERLSARIGVENLFPVRLAEEADLDEAQLLPRMAADRDADDAGPRRRRYQAAGEYVASHCDLLLALWDDDCELSEPESTGSIVRAKLRGLTSELLPAANSFTWVDCGSVVHLYVPRQKNPHPPADAKLGKMRWLHVGPFPGERPEETAAGMAGFQAALARTWNVPVAYRGESGTRWRAYARWQTAGNYALCRLARNLSMFNAGYPVSTQPALPLCKVLDPGLKEHAAGSPEPETLADALKTQAPEAFDALAPLIAARRHAADVSGAVLRPRFLRVLLGMFLLVFLFAACLHFFFHWHGRAPHPVPAAGHEAALSHAAVRTEAAVESPGEDHEEGDLRLRFVFGVVCLSCNLLGLLLFWKLQRSRMEERDQDCRALSEVLRVQFAWCLAGLNSSAAARYMERQSNELEWIRRAMSTLSMPHHRWSEWFHRLDDALQLRLLRWTQINWVNEQATYHDRRARELKHHLHLLHKLGSVLAISGVLQVATMVVDVRWSFLDTALFARGAVVALKVGAVAGLVLVAVFLGVWRRKSLKVRPQQKTWSRSASKTFVPTCVAVMEKLVPTEHESVYQSPHERPWGLLVSFGVHLPLATALGMVSLASAGTGAATFPAWPHVSELVTIISGICLLVGALSVAWTEKNLYSEQAFQFNAMASLFTTAGVHLGEHLRSAEGATDPAKRAASIRHAQRLLYDLGVEALHENAEWLILHRARPMEPMMAG